MSEIDEKYDELGGNAGFLGKPIGPETVCPDLLGRFRHFEKGSIYWHPLTGAHEAHGLIRKKWAIKGWEKSPLGYPKYDEKDTVGGRYSFFQRGVILWKSGSPEAFEVHGAIHGKYIKLGSEKGFLGYPKTDELTPPDKVGRLSHFEHGSIYWKPSIGAHEVHGLIRKFWADNGWETNPDLGYPISDELPTKKGDPDRFSDFENGVVYWRSGSAQASKLYPNTLLSQEQSEVFSQLSQTVTDLIIGADPRFYLTFGPIVALITDYEQIKGGVRNRQYKIFLGFGISLEGTNDPDCFLDLTLELRFHQESRTVQAILRAWHISTEVDWPTTWGVSAEEINEQIKPKIDAHLNKPRTVATIPDIFNVLSLKIMPNGDLNCYTEPL